MSAFTERVRNMLARKEMASLKEELNRQDLLQLVEMFNELIAENKLDEMAVAFRLLGKDLSIEVFEMLSLESQDQLIQAFADENAREVIMALEPDDRVCLLDEVPAKVECCTRFLCCDLGTPPVSALFVWRESYRC